MKKSKQQKGRRRQSGGANGLKQAITVAAAVASLGVSLGVDVEKGFADDFGAFQPATQQKGDTASTQHKTDSTQQKVSPAQLLLPAEQYKEQPSTQHKIDSSQHKGELPAVQHKMESDMHKTDGSSTQLKYENAPAEYLKHDSSMHKVNGDGHSTQLKYERGAAAFLKFDGKKLKNGDTFVIQNGQPFIRRQNGQMVPAAGKTYLFQDGTTLQMGK